MPIERHPSRRQAAVGLAATGVAVALALLATSSAGGAAGAASGRTTAAEHRDLRVTDDERGTLARSDTTTVLFDGTGGRSDGGPAGSNVQAQTGTDVTPASVEDPCAPTTSTPFGPTTSSTILDPTTSTTCPPPTTTSTTLPPPTSTTQPDPVEPPPSETPIDPGLDTGDAPELPTDDGRSPVTDRQAPDQGELGTVDPGGTSGPARATLTELLAVGDTATRGSVLYRADDEPIVALLSTTPLFRELRAGVADGPDVAAIESELRNLGYSGFSVDERYDAATAVAVERWERDLGRSAPDGVVTVGEVRLLEEPTTVLEHAAAVGDLLEPDDAVLVLGAESSVIEADVEAAEAAAWAVGTPVEVTWADGTTTTGSVVEVGRDVTDSQVPIVVALEPGSGTEAPIGSRVDLVRTVEERTAVVAVPVSAVVAGADGPAVRVAGAGGDEVVSVELGIVDDGWVEVTRGLAEGSEVRLPS
jgi:multidrug efflux system membrane fusion protein